MKNGISRRAVLKGACVLAGTALVPVGYSVLGRNVGETSASWVLATNQVGLDSEAFIARIAESTRLSSNELRTVVSEVRSTSAVRQDLTLVDNGQVLDLSRSASRFPELSDFMTALRARRAGATHFIQVSRIAEQASSDDAIDFLVDGRLVETVQVANRYRDIPVQGRMGTTHFRLEGGALSVVKSSCKHKTCERMAAQETGSIVCAPNRLVARLPKRQLVDAITA